MEHPTWEQLVDYAEGRLKGSEAATVTAHLGTCPSCTPDVAWLRETIRHLSDASLPAPPQAARVAVHAAFAHHRQARFEPPKRAWFPLPLARWAAIVVLAALAIVLLWSRSNSPALVAAVAETSGSVSVVRTGSAPQAVRPNLRLASGDRLLTGDDGRTRLAFGNEAVALTISPSSDVNIEEILFRDGRLEQLVARLDTGSLDVVVRGPGEFVLSTPAAVLKSHEGTFQVRTLAVDSLTLQVTTGEIEAITGAGAALMRSGEAVVLHADLPPGVSGPTPTPTA
ncbi:MAG TPA: hypothetical protein DEP84_29970, partial [Chloroflexi bacterium]|nr:hypothetical protein [Chloroflexota bacterium]